MSEGKAVADYLPGTEPPERFTWTAAGVRQLWRHPDRGPWRAELLLTETAARVRKDRAGEPFLHQLVLSRDAPDPEVPGQPSCAWCGSAGPGLVYDGLPQPAPSPPPRITYRANDPAAVSAALLAAHAGPLPHPVSLAEARDRNLLAELGTQEWACQDEQACQARRDASHPPVPLTAERFGSAIADLAERAKDAREDELALTSVLRELKAPSEVDDLISLAASGHPDSTPSYARPLDPWSHTLGAKRQHLILQGHSPAHNARLAAGLGPPPVLPVEAVPSQPPQAAPIRKISRARAVAGQRAAPGARRAPGAASGAGRGVAGARAVSASLTGR